MRDLDRLLAERFNRRGFMRLAGASGVGAALLAACRRAEDAGGPRATGGERPSIEEEPGNLQVFDWSGYGNGDYYPREEKQFLWSQYQRETGDTPEFILFENDSAGFTKAVSGTSFDVVHPCGYRYRDWVDAGLVQPFDTSLIPNFSALNPSLMEQGVVEVSNTSSRWTGGSSRRW
jgi:spermidine/putrescine-binding protein